MKYASPSLMLFGLLPAIAFAHGFGVAEGTQLDAAVSTSWRSQASGEATEAWRIPGVLMGGHALPLERSTSLDQASLTLTHHRKDRLYALLKAGTHGDSEISLEQAYAGWRTPGEATGMAIEAGRMGALFSPLLREHAVDRLFTENSLLTDAFFGRHFEDNGLRLLARLPLGIRIGIESWQGNAFPATPGQLMTDILGDITFKADSLSVTTGFFAVQATAENRTDNRYETGHSHGGSTISVSEVRFSGDTRLVGAHGLMAWKASDAATLRLQGEWIHQDLDGELRDATRLAQLDGSHSGFSHTISLQAGAHEIGVRHDALSLNNTVSGSGASILAPAAGLMPQARNPQKLNAGWSMQLLPGLKTRIEWIRDDSTGTRRERWAFGVVWQETLWRRH
ncbi:MAG: hypothetical protein ACK4UT_00125 [Moraxellaceae bacterium]